VPLLPDLAGERFDVVINATRLGLDPSDRAPIDFGVLGRGGAALDLVYGKHTTSFVQAAESKGIRASDGMEMLVQQGAVAFERWWGRSAPTDVMRAAIRRSLGR
jgi:shikimate dehydrogenase